jgi:hypothetical protein
MREKPKDNDTLLHMLEGIDNILEFVADKTFDSYRQDKILRFAVIKNLEIIGEAALLLSADFKSSNHLIYQSVWKEPVFSDQHPCGLFLLQLLSLSWFRFIQGFSSPDYAEKTLQLKMKYQLIL